MATARGEQNEIMKRRQHSNRAIYTAATYIARHPDEKRKRPATGASNAGAAERRGSGAGA